MCLEGTAGQIIVTKGKSQDMFCPKIKRAIDKQGFKIRF